MEEIFRDIMGYEGLYQVSNYGNVKSLERIIYRKNGRILPIKEKLLKCVNDLNGYLIVLLWKNNIPKHFFVHRLVGIHFLENINNYPQINHIDGIKTNNHNLNLEWCNSSQNITHAYQTGLNNNKGENNPHVKLTKQEVLEIKNLLSNNILQKEIAQKYNVKQSLISKIKHEKNWKNV